MIGGDPHKHVFCDHTDSCQCVMCTACREGQCWRRCAANWRLEQERDAERRAAKGWALCEELRRGGSLEPDQWTWLRAEGWGPLAERRVREHKESERKRDTRKVASR